MLSLETLIKLATNPKLYPLLYGLYRDALNIAKKTEKHTSLRLYSSWKFSVGFFPFFCKDEKFL